MRNARLYGSTLAMVLATTGLGATAAAAAPGTDGPRAAGVPLTADLVPQEEIAPFVGADDASGSATLWLNPGLERICVDLDTDGLDLALAHIHEGARGSNGGVVVDLTALIEEGAAQGCVDVDRSLVLDILRDPAGYSVNTHEGTPPSPAFFQGIRGQLTR